MRRAAPASTPFFASTLSSSGQLASAAIADGRPRTISFVTDLTGQVIRRDETDNNSSGGDPHEIFYRYGGRELGYTGNNGTLDTDYATSISNRTITPATGNGAFRNNSGIWSQYDDFDQSLESVNSYSSAGAGGYTARAADTLQSVAMQLWGDSSLWYKLAEANGIGAGGGLTEGQMLTVPPGILASGHSSETFKPYDPAKALGDLSPTAIKPAKKPGGCGMMGQILMIAIAVAVSAVVAPWATGLIVGQAATGLAAVAGAALGGAIGGAVGSVASQVVGVATGIQDKFNWKGVGLAALGGAIGGGLGKFGALSQAGSAATGSGAAINGTLGKIGQFLGKGAFVNDAARGILGNVLTQGIGVATGLQDKFSWSGVATAGVIAGVSGEVTRELTPNVAGATPSFAAVQAGAAAGALAGAAARSLVTGTSFGDNLIAVLPDVIGATLGNALGKAVNDGIVDARAERLAGMDFVPEHIRGSDEATDLIKAALQSGSTSNDVRDFFAQMRPAVLVSWDGDVPAAQLTTASAEAAQGRDSLGARWSRSSAAQRLHDPGLANAQRALNAIEGMIRQNSPVLRGLLVSLMPDAPEVQAAVLDKLERYVLPAELNRSGAFRDIPPDQRGQASRYLALITQAAYYAYDDRQMRAVRFFMSPAGGRWSLAQSTGIIASLKSESFLDPGRRQQSGGPGYGIAQWEREADRWKAFQQQYGRSLQGSSLDQQLRFVAFEFNGTFSRVASSLRQAQDPESAARIVTLRYEIPRYKEIAAPERAIIARHIFDALRARGVR